MQDLVEVLKKCGYEFEQNHQKTILYKFGNVTFMDDSIGMQLVLDDKRIITSKSELVFKQLEHVTEEDLPVVVCLGEVTYKGKQQLSLIFPLY